MTDTESQTDQTCFVIGPIGAQGSPDRKDADAILDYMITPVVEPLGFEPVRADRISEPGLISRQVMRHIIDSPLVIADLTGRNPNVYYELAVRHAIRKPLVQIISGASSLPFDIIDTRTIFFDLTDLASVEQAKVQMREQVKALLESPRPIDNPIAETLDLESYRSSDDDSKVALGQVLEALADLRGEVRSIQRAGVTISNYPAKFSGSVFSTPSGTIQAGVMPTYSTIFDKTTPFTVSSLASGEAIEPFAVPVKDSDGTIKFVVGGHRSKAEEEDPDKG